jgi:hypothetical protein
MKLISSLELKCVILNIEVSSWQRCVVREVLHCPFIVFISLNLLSLSFLLQSFAKKGLTLQFYHHYPGIDMIHCKEMVEVIYFEIFRVVT